MSSNILEKSDRPDAKHFERLKFDQGVGLSCTVLQQRVLHVQVFVSFGGDSGDRSAAQFSGAKWINEGQPCVQGVIEARAGVWMTCSEPNAMKPANSVSRTCERGGSRTGRWACRQHWVGSGGPFPHAKTVSTHVFGLGQFDSGNEDTGTEGSGRWSLMTAGWATDMKNVEQETEGTCTDAVEIDLQIEQES